LTIGKNLLSSNISSRCSHNMVNFGPLAAEIDLLVWGTPANFNRFCVFAALLHGNKFSGRGRQPNFAALKGGRHPYSVGRPPRWALAHILVEFIFLLTNFMLTFILFGTKTGDVFNPTLYFYIISKQYFRSDVIF